MSQEDAADLIVRAQALASQIAFQLELAFQAQSAQDRAQRMAGLASKCSRLAEAAFAAEEAAAAARVIG